jgi:hypothetical protein
MAFSSTPRGELRVGFHVADLRGVPLGMRREKRNPLVAVQHSHLGMRRGVGSKVVLRRPHVLDRLRPVRRKFPHDVRRRSPPVRRREEVGAHHPVHRAIRDLLVDAFFLAPQLRTRKGRRLQDRAADELERLHLGKIEVVGNLGDRPTVRGRLEPPLARREAANRGEECLLARGQVGDDPFPLVRRQFRRAARPRPENRRRRQTHHDGLHPASRSPRL